MDNEYLVGICCVVYNQKNFIKDCLDGFVKQKTNFKFKAVVFDDCSTDGTREIINEYAQKYPDIIKPLFPEENIAESQGFFLVAKMVFEQLNTKYVAYCEGDDYWTDENKLQKQVDFLESHTEYAGCFHPVKIIWQNKEKKDSLYPTAKKMFGKKFITKNDLLKTNPISSCSILYRWQFVDKITEEYFPKDIQPGDLYLHLLHAQVGNIAFLPDVMSVYRKNSGGIWYDETKVALKYGRQIINFHYNVYKNITNCSQKYLNKKFLPTMKLIMDKYYQNGCFDELRDIKKDYEDFYNLAFSTENKTNSKIKKYKCIFVILTAISTALLVCAAACLYFLLSL